MNLEQQNYFESYSGLGTDSIYSTNFSGTYEQWCETGTEERNFGSTSDQKVNVKQMEESADVVNASPEMALFSESRALLGEAGRFITISKFAIQLSFLFFNENKQLNQIQCERASH